MNDDDYQSARDTAKSIGDDADRLLLQERDRLPSEVIKLLENMARGLASLMQPNADEADRLLLRCKGLPASVTKLLEWQVRAAS